MFVSVDKWLSLYALSIEWVDAEVSNGVKFALLSQKQKFESRVRSVKGAVIKMLSRRHAHLNVLRCSVDEIAQSSTCILLRPQMSDTAHYLNLIDWRYLITNSAFNLPSGILRICRKEDLRAELICLVECWCVRARRPLACRSALLRERNLHFNLIDRNNVYCGFNCHSSHWLSLRDEQ